MAANTVNSLTILMTTFSSPKAYYSKPTQSYTLSSPPLTAFPSRQTLLLRCHRPRRPKRSDSILVHAGPPSSSTLILAFVLPLSLLIGTILVSIRIADDLDEKFVKELLMNEAMAQEEEYGVEDAEDDDDDDDEEEDDENDDAPRVLELEEVAAPATPRVRNRPKKEI
ncbi:uncharacterized protein LOC120273891 [Dioscorea cayenensis subsp. rotundata]|uniref:Uncharacterized protein LOC120273891 n=1 Tax=Dioscorea cayennensis subsp. rotundata TaxID=55577 RepID=A0AB40CCU5_DIOCR|nr:uncharacterized protein LOC120273891 [Dioscorea cayenensis subsp. rotundata]